MKAVDSKLLLSIAMVVALFAAAACTDGDEEAVTDEVTTPDSESASGVAAEGDVDDAGETGDTDQADNTADTDDGATTDDDSSTAEASESTEADPESNSGEPADFDVAPGLLSFRTPSGNIRCSESGTTEMLCQMVDSDVEVESEDCPYDYGSSVYLALTSVELGCTSDSNAGEDVPVLEYGETLDRGWVTCTSAETGLTCRNYAGGEFSMARAAIVIDGVDVATDASISSNWYNEATDTSLGFVTALVDGEPIESFLADSVWVWEDGDIVPVSVSDRFPDRGATIERFRGAGGAQDLWVDYCEASETWRICYISVDDPENPGTQAVVAVWLNDGKVGNVTVQE